MLVNSKSLSNQGALRLSLQIFKGPAINSPLAAHKELILQKVILDNEMYKLLNDEQKQKLLKDQDNLEKACVDGH